MRSAWLGLLALCACSGDRTALLTLAADTQTLILLTLSSGGASGAAYDVRGGDALEQTANAGASYLALEYSTAPERLGLELGPLPLVEMGAPLPTAERYHRLDGEAWSALTDPPLEVERLALPVASGCLEVGVTSRPFPDSTRTPVGATFALKLDADRVLVGTTEGRAYDVTLEETQLATAFAVGTPYLAAAMHDGEVFVAGPGRAVMRGHPDRGFADAPPLPFDADDQLQLLASSDDEPLELYATDGSLRVARFDGTEWRVLRESSPSPGEKSRPRLGRIGAGVVGLIGASPDAVHEITSTGSERVVDLHIMTRPTPDTAWSIAFVEGLGPIIGTRYLAMYRRVSGSWELLPTVGTTPRADVIGELGDGAFVAGGQDGVFAQWGPGDTTCLPFIVRQQEGLGFFRVRGGFVLLGATDDVHVSVHALRED